MQNILEVSNLSKQYRLGNVGTGTLSHDFNRLWARIRGKEDPYLKIGEVNDRSKIGTSDFVWALKDINFEVQQGEVLGIIGKNGAGKSTLLKVLSRVTGPTTGSIKANGRIASLLEVGTGFHPELTGRENIFLNGAILGMTRSEVRSKLDEIVDFSGVSRYVDTPVKRYSSGMYVRLAFAVAAHLEPEILIVDEVLAVGDAEFQKKAIGKMKSVSEQEGRTVLFVSHNMEAIKSFCKRALILKNGTIDFSGNTNDAILRYLKNFSTAKTNKDFSSLEKHLRGNDYCELINVKVLNDLPIYNTEKVVISFTILVNDDSHPRMDLTFSLKDELENKVFVASTSFMKEITKFKKGLNKINCLIPKNILNEGVFSIDRLIFVRNQSFALTVWYDLISFEVLLDDSGFGWKGAKEGIIRPMLNWELI